MKRYEGMFLFDSTVAREWSAIEQEIKRLCERIKAELLVCIKFDERKLAYEINRRKRGTYVLTYFNAAGDRIRDLERDAQLSEAVLRVLIVRADHLPEERLAELKAWPAETPYQPAGDGRRHEDERGRGRGGEEREPRERRDERGPREGRERRDDRGRGRGVAHGEEGSSVEGEPNGRRRGRDSAVNAAEDESLA